MSESEAWFKPYRGFVPKNLRQLINCARKVLNDKKSLRFLWDHTRSVHHYDALIDCIRMLSELDKDLVSWK